MTRRTFLVLLLAILAAASAMRFAWLRADPPSDDPVGIVWHDEGAWVHNARNQALWGTWRTDAWNPVFIAPVFTALEYGAFRTFGVGTWQARTVPAVSGLLAIAALTVGLLGLTDRRAALVGAALIATNYAFVMWNRAALMESTMTACIAIAWAAWVWSDRRPALAGVAGLAATAAWFTKASAAFFVAALALDAAFCLARQWRSPRAHTREGQAAAWALAGLAAGFLVAGAAFVWPHWTDYQFYNWQMTVTRKPSYSLHDLLVRASWLPFVQGIFSRMWFVLALAAGGAAGIAMNWRTARPGERLLVLWIFIGLAELVVHDSGNERRYVMFIPAIIALACLVLGRLQVDASAAVRRSPAIAALVMLPLGYLIAGSAVRVLLFDRIAAGDFKLAVRASALLAVAIAAGAGWRVLAQRRALGAQRTLTAQAPLTAQPIRAERQAIRVRPRPPRRMAALALAGCAVTLAWNVYTYARWAAHRTEVNADASLYLGHVLPPGTVVQGKLANGLALDNRIRPIFVGNGFGNYDDRLRRDDARYILTYDLPRVGYESSDGSGLIQGILDHYPRRRVVATLVVDETPGPDRAVLIDKDPDGQPAHARD